MGPPALWPSLPVTAICQPPALTPQQGFPPGTSVILRFFLTGEPSYVSHCQARPQDKTKPLCPRSTCLCFCTTLATTWAMVEQLCLKKPWFLSFPTHPTLLSNILCKEAKQWRNQGLVTDPGWAGTGWQGSARRASWFRVAMETAAAQSIPNARLCIPAQPGWGCVPASCTQTQHCSTPMARAVQEPGQGAAVQTLEQEKILENANF